MILPDNSKPGVLPVFFEGRLCRFERRMGYDCRNIRPGLLLDRLFHARLLVIPPPTGYYDPPILDWLLNGEGSKLETVAPGQEPELAALHALLDEQWRDVVQVEATGRGEATVAFVERLLKETGVLRALAHAKWMP